MNEMISNNSTVKTDVLKTFDFDGKYRLTIEKILEGQFNKYYMVRSYKKGLFGYKICSLAAFDIKSDDNHNYIKDFFFKPYQILDHAISYAKYVKKKKYPTWLNYQ